MKIKKIVSLLLATIMLLSAVYVSAYATQTDKVSVYFTLSGIEQKIEKQKITVASGTAKKYGYAVAQNDHNGKPVSGVTVFDVIVAAHELLYGNAFTAETKENYLFLDDGFMKKSFGKSTSATGFMVNNAVPHDGIYNPDMWGYTGYACDTAVLKDGDNVTFFFYQDTKFYMDSYAWFDSDVYNAEENEEITVTVNGYYAAWYGVNDWETILEEYAQPLEDVSVYTYSGNEKVLLGVTDEKGQVTFSFADGGEHLIFCEGDEDQPIITTYSSVVVPKKDEPSKKPSLWDTIKEFFENVIAFFKMIFNKIFGK